MVAKQGHGNILKIPMDKITRLFFTVWRPGIAIEKDDEQENTYTERQWSIIAENNKTIISADFGNGILESKNNSKSSTLTFNTTHSTSTGDMIFFAVKSYLYDAKFYGNNIIIRNFIPCYSTTNVTDVNGTSCSSGTIGLYDTVEGKFYINQGSGSFRKGNDV